MKTPSIKTLVRAAYRNRYALDKVTIDGEGKIVGHWFGRRPGEVNLGNLADCHSSDAGEPGRRTGIRLYNGDALIYTFGPNGEGCRP